MTKPSYLDFDAAAYPWKKDIDYRAHPELYRVGKGEQGVLICEPYKSELVPHWRFKTPDIARASSQKLYEMFQAYLDQGEFVGADMARKFLQMGFTRARRYTNYRGGRKYRAEDKTLLEKGTGDPQKAESARIFYEIWQKAEHNPQYAEKKQAWKDKLG
ncbi:DUF4385 domain-containing protein [Aetokthonos hydrillicola Thurmond2011]|jgi:hypothetical protein|uniref:DUF4385 domain-containing protein n=1 Tax=Aetokthonos hydrillicola Thurmond2011 TaxID=2712845 RepID=A0AAP5IBC7_9CYAN|nr:DUF4385 domain-containing protein [Aetokthonos hydrillicola]MBO3462456.1 DUF4385 domain-containing protein [Aetokthonos hydrillicola CCALA 1050]MBW4589850.1 DUF4385 domain-containing protein [Aetokthonos hydrillicola CCALA 1050]MDR9898420.1 DUF4385 domain-containing protein [Aetokthonos hydrillicola Thurmond2011]